MLVPVVAFPVSAVPGVSPLRRSPGRMKAGKDRGGSRRNASARFEVGERREAPSGDPAVATSSSAVLSALLDLPRGG